MRRASIRLFSTSPKPLKDMPGLPVKPFIGSLLAMQSLKNPWTGEKLEQNEIIPWEYAMWEKYGDVCRVGLPGLGKGRDGEVVCVFDPIEYMKVVELAPKHPRGVVQMEWPFLKAWQANKFSTVGMFGQDEEWWRLRQQLQKNFVGPKDARKYVPSMVQAAKLAVEGAKDCEQDVEQYLAHCSFDMISSILLGQMMESADPKTVTDDRNLRFVNYVKMGTEDLGPMLIEPKEILMYKMGFTSKKLQKCIDGIKHSFDSAKDMIRELHEKWEKNELTDAERRSYAVAFFNRENGINLTEQELAECIALLLFAGVDTTSGLLYWLMVNLGQNPEAQERLRREVVGVLGPDGGLHSNIQVGAELPYLSAFIRESYRLNPAVPSGTAKTAEKDVVLGGYHIPKDTYVMFMNVVYGLSDKFVDDPLEFKPERWLPEAVESRKGTEREVIDHRLLANGFSHGARMCPGARVAALEVVVFLTEIVRRWEIYVDPSAKFVGRQKLTVLPVPTPEIKFTAIEKGILK